MKQQLSLQQLAQTIQDRAAQKADFVADTRSMAMADTGKALILGGDAYEIGKIAHEQIADRLDIPAKYYKRMAADRPDLLATNVNTWLHNNPEMRMVRTLGGNMRAFLSDKYHRLDDDGFANVTLSSISDDPSAEVVACAITEEKTHIKYISKRTQTDVKVGDPVQFGIAFSNSEVGRGRLSASLLVLRLICLNGSVSTEDMFGQNHVGRRVEVNMGEIFQMDTIAMDAQATMLKLRDFTQHILNPQRLDAFVNKLRGLNEVKVIDPIKSVEKLARTFTLPETEKTSILTHLIKGGDLTGYGIQNAVTAAAQDASLSYERAHELEVLGGKLINLQPAQWRDLTRVEDIKLAA